MRKLLLLLPLLAFSCSKSPSTDWYQPTRENRPYIRWWWMGSAVDKENLTYHLEEFADKGFGGVEITPIYGVQGNEANDIPYLSDKWMDMLGHVISEGKRLDLQVDMSNCTGWPFGGPWIADDQAAMTFGFNEDTTAIIAVPTGQVVKRAAPGGEGWVMNHYDKSVLEHYLEPFDQAFAATGCPWPDTFFNDSFEVYGAGWDSKLPERFYQDHGYRLEDHIREFARNGSDEFSRKLIADYRSTLSKMYLNEFVRPWTAWAHSHGVRTRNQAHGAPANLIDVYAAADIPECESFGRTPFDIKGLHLTGPWRLNDCDPAVFKFASSAAHISGKNITSCEALTWLTEHFHTSLGLCKPELDLIFASGINHVYLHGAPYSPKGLDFPGWKFYATINLAPGNPSLWGGAKVLADYITRCQAFLSTGSSDADFLLYFPIDDIWHYNYHKQFMQLEIHKMDETMPYFKKTVLDILNKGYDVDYVSDDFLAGVRVLRDGRIATAAGTVYKGLCLPEVKYLPEATASKIQELRDQGALIVEAANIQQSPVLPETLMKRAGMHMVRRNNEAGGKNYFITNLGPSDLDDWVELSTAARSVELFDAMTGEFGMTECRSNGGTTSIRLQLKSGQSVLVKTFPQKVKSDRMWQYYKESDGTVDLGAGHWTLSFVESQPAMPCDRYEMDGLRSWTEFEGGDVNLGTGLYSTSFELNSDASEWLLDLGDVRERATVRINGKTVGQLIAPPFSVRVGEYLVPGRNSIEIEVTNLPANRIAQLDREGYVWRIFKDVNIAAVKSKQVKTYQTTQSYGDWEVVPSGLNSTVKLIPLEISE